MLVRSAPQFRAPMYLHQSIGSVLVKSKIFKRRRQAYLDHRWGREGFYVDRSDCGSRDDAAATYLKLTSVSERRIHPRNLELQHKLSLYVELDKGENFRYLHSILLPDRKFARSAHHRFDEHTLTANG
jgi:hypothetical protein